MAPNLRSVFAQVHRKSLSIGSRCKNELEGWKGPFKPPFSHGTSLLLGFSAYCCSQIYNTLKELPTVNKIFEEQEARLEFYEQRIADARRRRSSTILAKK